MDFNGVFTEDVRKRLQEKRKSLSLRYGSAASLLGVDMSTYRKWELGLTERCSLRNVKRVNAFLDGEIAPDADYKTELPGESSYDRCMEIATNVYKLISNYPDLVSMLEERLEEAVHEAIKSYMEEDTQ